MQIGELARHTGLSRDALRFYEKRGLIRTLRRPNGYRHYGPEAVFILEYVRTAQRLGFSLTEIEAEVPALVQGGLSGDRIANILREKIALVDARIAEMQGLRDDLVARLEAACPIALAGQPASAAI